VKINVTEEDIKNGQPENIQCCAIALALCRTFKTDDVEVKKNDLTDEIILKVDDVQYDQHYFSKLDHITTFIEKFDIGEDVEPFTFEINDITKESK